MEKKKPEVKVVGKIDLPSSKSKPKAERVEKFKKKVEVAAELKPKTVKKKRERKPRNSDASIGLMVKNEDVIPQVVKTKREVSKTTLKLIHKYGCKSLEEYRKVRNANKKRKAPLKARKGWLLNAA